jgi:hypothetical protein
MNKIKDIISMLEGVLSNKQPQYEVMVVVAEGVRTEFQSPEEHLESIIEITVEDLYEVLDESDKKYLDGIFTFSIVKFIDKKNEVFYRLFGYPETGDEVEFGVRPHLTEIVSLLERYSQEEPDFQVIHEKDSE